MQGHGCCDRLPRGRLSQPSEDENSCSTCRSAYAPHAGNRVRRLGLPIAQVPLDDLRSAAKKFVFVDLIDPFQNIHRLIDKF